MTDNQHDGTSQESSGADDAPKDGNRNGGERLSRRSKLFILAGLVVVGCLVAAWFWYKSKVEITTDDAFVEAPIHMISSRVPGQVARIPVDDNQPVAKGDLLIELDDDVYRARLSRAEARLDLARNEAAGDTAAVNAATAALRQAEARAEQAGVDLKRAEALFAREVIPRERLDQLQTAATIAANAVTEAREKLRKARAALGSSRTDGVPAAVAQRGAELELARLELSYTRITAPVPGYVTRKSIEIGNNVQAGQPLLSIVQLDGPWVLANYKESQLTHVKPGQKVTMTVDAYPGREFSGHVDSIMAGTGAAFALLPPENATGNYVKIVQRIPVKIRIDPDSDPEHLLRVGMSVVPTIYTGRSLGDILARFNPFG